MPTCGNCLTELTFCLSFPQMGALAHETATKYVQIKEVNMDQIECRVLGEVPMVAECAFMNLPLWLALSDLRYCTCCRGWPLVAAMIVTVLSLLALLDVQVTVYDCCITAFKMCCRSFSQHFIMFTVTSLHHFVAWYFLLYFILTMWKLCYWQDWRTADVYEMENGIV